MALLCARLVAVAGGAASLSLIALSGFGTDQGHVEVRLLPPDQRQSLELVTPYTQRSVEDWARIARATHEAQTCLKRELGSVREVGHEELDALTLELVNGCFARQGTSEQAEQVDGLPFTYAIHRETGLPVELVYECGCIVPNRCWVFARFADVWEHECCERGGVPIDVDGNYYGGCVPIELASPEQLKPSCNTGEAPPPPSRFASAIQSRPD
jgi:hypothetical protein